MTARQIAALIPAKYRTEILETNMIATAQAVATDGPMSYLATLWKEYIAPHEDIRCPLCLARILKNYHELQPFLVDLEKQTKLLDQL